MAITISQSPTSPNMSNADLLFEVDSTQKTQPQFQYVCDVQDENKTVLQRIKQQPSPQGYGVFNVGQIITNYLESDNVWKTAEFATSSLSSKEFWVAFGEEYGTSTSGSVTLYNGVAAVSGSPAKSGSYATYLSDGLVEPNAGYWNFASSSYYYPEEADVYNTFSHQVVLSNAPTTQKAQDGEYVTISAYNGNFVDSDTNAQNISYVKFDIKNAAGTTIQNVTLENIVANGGGPKVNANDLWSTVAANQTSGTRLLHIGVGPQNLADGGNTLNAAWASYTVTLQGAGDDGLDNDNAVFGQMTFTKDNPECISDGVRFAWKNEFGVWDYYTAKLAINSGVQIQRNAYQQSFVDYGTGTSTVTYDLSRRGSSQFYNKGTQRKNVTTDILTQAQADWLRELFFSTNVYVQEGTNFLPVVISDAAATEKTNPRSQKVFQYSFNFEYANQLRPRR